jgi:Flp pilus assembly protein TadD
MAGPVESTNRRPVRQGRSSARRVKWWIAWAALIVAVAWPARVVLRPGDLAAARRLVCRAYTANRVQEMRLAGAAYGPIQPRRTQSAEFLEAEARIARGLAAHPDDSAWLQLQGRADLLESREDASIAELERAHALDPSDAGILSDLGAAYFQKAVKGADPDLYVAAFEALSQGTRLKPGDPVLLFNRALAAERIYAYHEARGLWQSYLGVASQGGWAQEARAHLEQVNHQLEGQQAYAAATVPERLIAELRRGAPWDQHFAPDEEYLNVAVRQLLPLYYSSQEDEGIGRVLQAMAGALLARHGDTWLRDVLRTPHSRAAAVAFAALGRAAEAEQSSDWGARAADAGDACRLFRSAGSQAGALRAQLASLYSLQARSRVAPCVQAGRPLEASLRATRYSWLRTQSLLERALCEGWAGNFDQAWNLHREAIQAATRYHYPVLLLRGLTISAVWQRDIGNVAVARQALMQALALFWTARYPGSLGYNLYTDLSLLAHAANDAYTAVAWARESLDTGLSAGRPLLQAGTLHQLAVTEMAVGFKEASGRRLQEAAAALAKLPADDQRLLRVVYTIELAEAEAALGQVDEPLARLERVRDGVGPFGTVLNLRFYAALGRLQLRRGDLAESAKLLERALQIGEAGRAALLEGDRLPWAGAMGDAYRALVECRLKSGADPQQSWTLWSRYRTELFDRRVAGNPAPKAVAPGEAMLSFAALPSGMAAWLATAHGFRFRWLAPPTNVLNEAAGRLVGACATPRSPLRVLREDARQLSRWLLGPWDQELEGVRTVVVETDGPVASLPIAALVRAGGHYWGESFAVRIREWSGPRSRPPAPFTQVTSALAVGAPAVIGEDDLPPLPEARAEAEKVFSRFPRSSKLLVGKEATLTEVRDRLPAAEIFHFAGHGYGGEGGGLILRGPNGAPALLRAAEIQGVDLSRCRLAVLSGCATGAGERHGPGDPQSLVRAFLRAGARQVVASLWNLNSAATQLLIDQFYTALCSDATPAESLRRAAVAVRSKAEYQHPYYWAGLQVFDDQ